MSDMSKATAQTSEVFKTSEVSPRPVSRFNQFKPYLVLVLISIILIAGESWSEDGLLGSYWYTALAIAAAVVLKFVLGWVSQFKQVMPYLAPVLISIILLLGESTYGILQSYWYTASAIAAAIVLEIALSYFATGRFPHLASAYITGISVGILLRALNPWVYVLCSALSISSKYALRVRGRHLWNPSNLGVSVLLFLIPEAISPLGIEWGNDIWVPIIILCFGFLILLTLGRLHITLTYVVAFSLLSMLRSVLKETPLESELGLLTAPSYLLFMFFMITDPKTTTRTWQRQIAVTVLVAVVETILRLYENVHAPYYALFIVFPIANLLEISWEGRAAAKAASAPAQRTNDVDDGKRVAI